MDATTRLLASYAADISYDALTPSAIHECKRRIIDTLACATAALTPSPWPSHGAWLDLALARNLHAFWAMDVHDSEQAAFVNGAMMRFLDWNDTIIAEGLGHPSDAFGAALAMADCRGLGGRRS